LLAFNGVSRPKADEMQTHLLVCCVAVSKVAAVPQLLQERGPHSVQTAQQLHWLAAAAAAAVWGVRYV
jgi:hypothetical protein